ncbi:MAG: CDP-alcohol phosphatidyltransferase family protein [Planctomycetota bacterium]|nr:CDP-alcohol phosphatidyltransferase family protein [Planctomycetota bacterium]
MSIPNLLTLFRLATAPIFLALFIGTGPGGFLSHLMTPAQGILACIVCAALSEISDVLDGILARKLNQVSDFGKLLDPYADSTFRLSVYFAFASQAHGRWIPLWMVMILFYRDLLVTVIRTFGVERGVFVHARASGKIKAIAQATVAITVMVIAAVKGEEWVAYEASSKDALVTGLAHTLMWLVTAVTAWSAWDYTFYNRHLFSTQNTSDVAPSERPPND